jgi:hypothetical protein
VSFPSKVMAREFDAHAGVCVTGRTGLAGPAIVRRLAAVGFSDVLTALRPRLGAARGHALAGA